MSDERDPRPAGSSDPEGTAGIPATPATDPAIDPAVAASAEPTSTAGTEPTTPAGFEPAPASASIPATAAVDGLPANEPDPAVETEGSQPIVADAVPAATVAAAPPAIPRARRAALAAMAGTIRLLRFALVLALFVGGVALGYQAHLSTIVGSAAPVADPATAGNQPAPVIRELIAAVESNDADRIRSVVPSEPYKSFTSEMQNWSFQEVTSVETLATFEDGTRTATAFVMIGRSAQGNPVTINLVVETDGGQIVDFK